MARGSGGMAVAVIGLLTAVLGAVSSPIWGPSVCRAIGVCHDTEPNDGGNTNGGDVPNSGGNSNIDMTEWTCPGGQFCAWDERDAGGTMIVEKDTTCRLYDIGSAGLGDLVSSFQNRTGTSVGLYNWNGQEWALLLKVADGEKGNMPESADNVTDAVKICD